MTKRWTAYKMWIKDVVEGTYTEDGFINFHDLQANRVRILGTVVMKFIGDDRRYGFFILDDSTETIRVRSFEDTVGLIDKVNVGDIVDVVGRIRKYDNEIYVIPEIVKKIDDPNFELLRKLELISQDKRFRAVVKKEDVYPLPEPTQASDSTVGETVEEDVVESPKQKVIKLIKELDKGDGVNSESLISRSGLDENVVENIINDMMNDGDIFEPRAGKIKLLI
jgi:RPA family protein